jgi:hypothetical protein
MGFSNLLDVSSFFIGVLINLLLIALICFYFKRKIDNLEESQSEQAKMLFQIIKNESNQTNLVNSTDESSNNNELIDQSIINELYKENDTKNIVLEDSNIYNSKYYYDNNNNNDDDDDDDDDDEDDENDEDDVDDDDDDDDDDVDDVEDVDDDNDKDNIEIVSIESVCGDDNSYKNNEVEQDFFKPKVKTIEINEEQSYQNVNEEKPEELNVKKLVNVNVDNFMEEKNNENINYEKYTIKQLKNILETNGVSVQKRNIKKQELINMLMNNNVKELEENKNEINNEELIQNVKSEENEENEENEEIEENKENKESEEIEENKENKEIEENEENKENETIQEISINDEIV